MGRVATLPRAAFRRPPRLVRAMLTIVVGCALIGAFLWWLRGSPLLAVEKTTVTGVEGPQAKAITDRIKSAAKGMATFEVDPQRIQAAVSSYPIVRSVSVEGSPPHGLRVTVHQNVPIAVLVTDSERIAVAGDGRVLRGLPTAGLTSVPMPGLIGSDRVTDRRTRSVLAALEAAPRRLRRQVAFAGLARATGLTFALEDGPALRFGDGGRLRAKWVAVETVLTDPDARKATYIDVRYPERPAAGGLAPSSGTTDPVTAGAQGAATTPNPQP